MAHEDPYDASASIRDARTAQDVRRLVAGLHALAIDPEEEVPADFYTRVIAKAQTLPRPRQRLWDRVWGWTWFLTPALAGCLLISVAYNVREFFLPTPLPQDTDRPLTLEGLLRDRGSRGPTPPPLPSADQADLPDTPAYTQQLATYRATLQAYQLTVAPILRDMAAFQTQYGQYRQAMEAATAALLFNSTDAPAYRFRGLAARALGNNAQACRDLQQATALGDAEARETLRTLEGMTPPCGGRP